MRILISGSTGFIGSHLSHYFKTKGHEVVALTRKQGRKDSVFWDPKVGKADPLAFEGFDAVIHLAGKNISSGVWTEKFKRELFTSRCRDTWLLSQTLSRLENPPKTFISASAIGFYGDRGEEILTEESPKGKGFFSDLCEKWEDATKSAKEKGIRCVHTRFGVVLSPRGGILKKLLPLFRLGLGAIIGSGNEHLSWIDLEDVIGGMEHILQNHAIQGPVNFTSPHSTTSKEFAKTLASVLHRPCFFSIGRKPLRMMFGQMADEMLLASAKVLPTALENSGYFFKYSSLDAAMQHFF